MANQRRGKRVLNHDIVNVTDLDDDFETLTYSRDTNVSRDSSSNKQRTVSNSVNGAFNTNFRDPLSNKNYQDPLKTMAVKDPFAKNGEMNSGRSGVSNNSSLDQGSDTKRNLSQKDLTQQTVRQSEEKSTQHNLRQMKTLPSRQVSTTPLSPNKPVSSVHITKRYNSTPRVKPNQKGFGHEERDLFIDDIEDF